MWVGGGNNRANNPSHWTPAGAPAPGDSLTFAISGTMNIRGDDLAGNTLTVGGAYPSPVADVTLNLSHNANVSVSQAQYSDGPITANIKGYDRLDVSSSFPSTPGITVNLASHSVLFGGFSHLTFGSVTVNSESGSLFVYGQNDSLDGTRAIITPDVLGVGAFSVDSAQSMAGFIEFKHSVSSGQTVTLAADPGRDLSSVLQIDEPKAFHGSVVMDVGAKVELVGIANADSYSFANDVLTLFAGQRAIDRLHVSNDGTYNGQPHDIQVSESGSVVYVTQIGLTSPPPGSIVLPIHNPGGAICS
jgi:hypothetical protein